MLADHLARLHPTVYHMADAANRDGLRAAGLLSTTALLDRLGLTGDARHAIEARHRPAGVVATTPLGTAVVRDQKPLDPIALARCLTGGVTPEQWYRTLNNRVYFFPDGDRLARMLRVYVPTAPQLVLAVDTAELCRRHGDRLELAHINTGFATRRFRPAPRGPGTFVPLADYAWSRANAIAEVTVPYAVPDVLACVRGVTLHHGDRIEPLAAV